MMGLLSQIRSIKLRWRLANLDPYPASCREMSRAGFDAAVVGSLLPALANLVMYSPKEEACG